MNDFYLVHVFSVNPARQMPDYGHKTSDVFNVEESASDDGSDTDGYHDNTINRLKEIHRDTSGADLNESERMLVVRIEDVHHQMDDIITEILFKILNSRMMDGSFYSIDYLEDLLWDSSSLK